MPYHTEKQGKKYVVKSDADTPLKGGMHSTKKAAQDHATAVNIAEGHVPGVKPNKKKAKK